MILIESLFSLFFVDLMALLDSSSNRKGLRHTIYRPESPPSRVKESTQRKVHELREDLHM